MKSNIFALSLVIALLLVIRDISSNTITKTSSEDKPRPIISAKNTPKNNDPKGKADKVNKQIDSVGKLAEPPKDIKKDPKAKENKEGPLNENVILDKFPWKVTKCNQIVMTDCEHITDLREYRNRSKAFCTLTIYDVSIFKEKDAKTLIHNVPWYQTKFMPKKLKGAKGCLVVDGGNVSADMTICFKKPEEAVAMMKVIQDFERCRTGDNLKPIPEAEKVRLQKTCGESSLKKKDQLKDFKMKIDIRPDNKWDADRERYFQPSPILVPGTLPPKTEEELKKEKALQKK